MYRHRDQSSVGRSGPFRRRSLLILVFGLVVSLSIPARAQQPVAAGVESASDATSAYTTAPLSPSTIQPTDLPPVPASNGDLERRVQELESIIRQMQLQKDVTADAPGSIQLQQNIVPPSPDGSGPPARPPAFNPIGAEGQTN